MPNKPQNPSVKDTYNQVSDQFSASRNYIWPDLKPFVAEVTPGSSVLDLGCGNGRLLLGLPENIDYLGIDISENLIEKAKELHPNNNFLVADLDIENTWHNLPRYDYIFCIAVIHHLSSPESHQKLLTNIESHLKLSGKVLITSWNLWQPQLTKYHQGEIAYIPFQGTPRFHYIFTKEKLEKLAQKTKLDLVVEETPKNFLVYRKKTAKRRS